MIRPYPTAVIDGDVTLTTNGAVFADKIVHGRIIVKAADVTISNVVVVGGDALPQNSHWLIDTHSGTNTRIEFTTVRAAHPNTHVNGIGYRNFTAYRVDVSGVVDAFSAIPVSSGANVNISIQGSYGHDLVHFSPDPGHPGPDSRTHNDVIQSHGGNGLQVIGSSFSAYHDPELGTQPAPHSQLAAMMINTGIGPSSGLDIEDNWLGGGAYCVNGGGAIGGGGRFLRNRFDRGMATPKGQPDAAFTLVFDATFTQTSTGNVFEDNGHPVQVRTNY
ncbi:MAG: hypothetical protein IPJ65_18990 [Archangiaceae bacterium]|nr:hypothetical protein [Archangiaceae bacterium]